VAREKGDTFSLSITALLAREKGDTFSLSLREEGDTSSLLFPAGLSDRWQGRRGTPFPYSSLLVTALLPMKKGDTAEPDLGMPFHEMCTTFFAVADRSEPVGL